MQSEKYLQVSGFRRGHGKEPSPFLDTSQRTRGSLTGRHVRPGGRYVWIRAESRFQDWCFLIRDSRRNILAGHIGSLRIHLHFNKLYNGRAWPNMRRYSIWKDRRENSVRACNWNSDVEQWRSGDRFQQKGRSNFQSKPPLGGGILTLPILLREAAWAAGWYFTVQDRTGLLMLRNYPLQITTRNKQYDGGSWWMRADPDIVGYAICAEIPHKYIKMNSERFVFYTSKKLRLGR